MQTRIVRGEIAGLAGDALRLHLRSISQEPARADCAAVALRALQTDFQPMIARWGIVAQQGGRLIPVHDENVQVPIIVEVAEGASAAHVARIDGGTGLIPKLPKSSILLVAENDARAARGYLAG